MPYIQAEARRVLAALQGEGVDEYATTAGELNYQLTKTITLYITRRGLNYGNINDVLGALEGAKLEFYRRVAVPYENQKVIDNGDVYPVELTQGGQK